jgi:hypothetical protein
MIHFQGHDDTHQFLVGVLNDYVDKAESDLRRCVSDWSVKEATDWLEKVQTARDRLERCVLVDRAHVRAQSQFDISKNSLLVRAAIMAQSAGGISAETAENPLAVSMNEMLVTENLLRYLFDPPTPAETSPVQP